MNAVAALAATEERAWTFVDELWALPIPTGKYRYYDGMLYMLGLMHVSGSFKIWTNTSRPIPGSGSWPPPPDPDHAHPCQDSLHHLCLRAKQSSVGNCLVCCGVHQQALMAAGCTQGSFDAFCQG